jgi:DNA-binding NarL/FixJ family response regulator
MIEKGTSKVLKPSLLVVDDEEVMRDAIARFYGASYTVETAISVETALDLIRTRTDFAGAILDLGLGDGSGFDVLSELRKRGARYPVLVLTGHFVEKNAAESLLLGAEFLPKPPGSAHLDAFALRMRRYYLMTNEGRAEFIRRWGTEYQLTPRQVQTLELAIADASREEIAKSLGVGTETVKTHVKKILKKSRNVAFKGESFSDLLRHLKQEVQREADRVL